MNDRGYKMLGFVVWNGGRWYLRRKVRRATVDRLPPRRVAVGATVLGAGVIVAAALTRRTSAPAG